MALLTISYVGGASGEGHLTGWSVSLNSLSGGTNSSPSEGDIVIVNFVRATGSGVDENLAMSTSGYTELFDIQQTNSINTNQAVFWKIMGASPDSTVEVTASNASTKPEVVTVQVWRNVDQITPMDVTPTTTTVSGSSRANSPAITPVTAGAVIIACGAAGGGNDSDNTVPSGMTNFEYGLNYQAPLGGSAKGGICSYSSWTSGSYDPAAWGGGNTASYHSYTAATLALRPASDTPAFTPSPMMHLLQMM